MSDKAHPEDILVVGQMWEQSMWGEFDKRQIVSVQNLGRQLRGRRYRHAYVTDLGRWHADSEAIFLLDIGRVTSGGQIRNAKDWKPEPEPSIWQRIGKGLLDLCARFG